MENIRDIFNKDNGYTIDQINHKLDRIERYSLLAAKNMLNLDDASFLTGLSKSYIYKLTCSQQIPHYKPNGKHIYFDRKEIEDWLKQNRIATAQEIDQNATNYVVTGRMNK